MGIRLTVAEEDEIYSDAELIKMYGYPENYYKNVKKNTDYCDIRFENGNSFLSITYMITGYGGTAQQYINLLEADQMSHNNDKEPVSEKFEKVLCGQTYQCLGITLANAEPHYMLVCVRYVSNKGWVFLRINTDSKEKADEMLAVFDTQTIEAGTFKEIC